MLPLPPQARKRKLIADVDDEADEVDSHPPPPQCKIVRLPTPRSTPPATEAVPPQAPPQAPTPPRAPTPPQPQDSPRAEAEPAASKDYSSAKSDGSDDSSDDDDDIDSADRVAPEADDDVVAAEAPGAEANATEDYELAIINPSQELAIVATREAGVPHISLAPRMQARRHRPIQDTQLDSLYPRETFPIYTGAVRHGPEFDLEVHR